jgi:hypothetical protein
MRTNDEARGDREPEIGPEVPEADALEQQQPALPDDVDEDEEPATIPPEVPEADALEQARSVPPEDETGR